jgi:hypothetical protein
LETRVRFPQARWGTTYSEDTILYLLAIASPTHPIPARSWYALWREIVIVTEVYAYFTTIGVPLFMHQYSHAWIDYRETTRSTGRQDSTISKTLLRRHWPTGSFVWI